MTLPLKYRPIRVGPLPVEKINRALGTELEPGEVWVSSGAHEHIARDHPDDYAFMIAAIFEIVGGPLYVGQDPKHHRNFYVVRALPAQAPTPHGLVAIGFELNRRGEYSVKSAYSIDQADLNARRAARRLHLVT